VSDALEGVRPPPRSRCAGGGESAGSKVIGQPIRTLSGNLRTVIVAESQLLLGDNLLPLLLLAFGGAMAVGSFAALVRPPQERRAYTELTRPPLLRTLVFGVMGTLVALWALASLIAG
jgi:hypothetical protein